MSVHPLGFRIGITKKHQSQWFARFQKNNYKNNVIEDRMLINSLLNNYFSNFQSKNKELNCKITRITIERNLIPAEIIIHIHAVNCDYLLSNLHKKNLLSLNLNATLKHVRHTPSESAKKNISLNLVQKKINLFVNKLININKQRVYNYNPIKNTQKALNQNTHNEDNPEKNATVFLSIDEVSRGKQTKGGLLTKMSFSLNKRSATVFLYDNNRLTVSTKSILTSLLNASPFNNKTHFGTPNNITTPKERLVSAFISILNKKFLQSLKASKNNLNSYEDNQKENTTNKAFIKTTKTPLREFDNRKKTLPSRNFIKNYFTQINLVTNKTTKRSRHFKRLLSTKFPSDNKNQKHAFIIQPNNYINLNTDKECSKIQVLELLKQRIMLHKKQHSFHYLSSIKKSKIDSRNFNKFVNKLVNSSLEFKTEDSSVNTQNINKNIMGLKQHVEESTTDFLIRSRGIQNTVLTPKIVLKFYSVDPEIQKTKALFVADTVAEALENRKSFKGVIKKQKEELMRAPGVKGIKIKVSGRLNGAEIARSEWVRAGRVPLQTLRANIDYAFKTAKTIYGIIGIKVWIYKN